MQVTNYHVKAAVTSSNPPAGTDVLILAGAENSTVVKSLEVISGAENAIANVFRKDSDGNVYGNIKLNLTPYIYVMLCECFIAIPSGHQLFINADSQYVEAIASVVEL